MNQPLDASAADLFQTGGSLAVDAPTYVKRDADDELYAAIKKGEFCYVLNSRQMGKSSLRVQVMRRLQAEGVACAAIDITRIGSQQVEASRWYAGLIRSLVSGFELPQTFSLRSWLQEHEYLTPVQQLGEFIESVLLVQIEQPVVIFVDEIDSVLSLKFPTDDLFTFIRACYNQRVDNAAYGRLTFVLLGVATPADLVRDKTRTPFNVGKAIELSGLQFDRAQPLVEALSQKLANPAEVLQCILSWTEGQPFLTQKLCRLVVEQSEAGASLTNEMVDCLVKTKVIDHWETQDDQDHLRTIQARILQDERKAGRRLGIYQQVLQQGAVLYDGSPEQMELRLSGLVVAHRGNLEVYNRVYEQVFNAEWVNQALGRLRPYAEAITAWLTSERQDDSRLLRGQALIDAQGWALGKNLGTQDYEFLAASRELDFKMVKAALVTQEKANQILEEANQTAARRLKLSTGGVAFALSFALIASGWGWSNLKWTRKSIELEQQGASLLLRHQTRLSSGIDVLLESLEIGQALKSLMISRPEKPSPKFLDSYPATSPVSVLRASLNQIIEVNQVKGNYSILSGNGQRIAIYSLFNKFSSVHDQNGKELFRIEGIPSSFSHDGQRFATYIEGESLSYVYDQNGRKLFQLKGTYPFISGNGQRVVADLESENLSYVYDQNGNELFQLKGTYSIISDDGQRYVTHSESENLSYVYDQNGKELFQLKGISPFISSNGQRIATHSESKNLSYVYNQNGREMVQLKGIHPNISADGKRIATHSGDELLGYMYDQNGNELYKLKGIYPYISQDGQHIIAESSSAEVSYVYGQNGNELFQLRGNYPSISNNGRHIVACEFGNFEQVCSIYQLNSGVIKIPGFHASFDDHGQLIATHIESRSLSYVYDKNGKELFQLKGTYPYVSNNGKLISTHIERKNLSYVYDHNGKELFQLKGIYSYISDDGQRISTVSSSENLSYIYNQNGKELFQLKGLSYFNNNGKLIATFSEIENLSYVYDPNGKELFPLRGVHPHVSNDGQRVVTFSSSENLSYMYNHNGKKLFQMKGIYPYISDDGQHIFTSSLSEGLSYVYDQNGKELFQLTGVYSRISKDGKFIVTHSHKKGFSRIYERNGNLLAEYPGYEARFLDNKHLIMRSAVDDTLEIWPIDNGLDDLLAKGCHRLRHYFASYPKEKPEVCSQL